MKKIISELVVSMSNELDEYFNKLIEPLKPLKHEKLNLNYVNLATNRSDWLQQPEKMRKLKERMYFIKSD